MVKDYCKIVLNYGKIVKVVKKNEILTITRPPRDRRFKSLRRFTLANISIITSIPFSPTDFYLYKRMQSKIRKQLKNTVK